MSNEDLCQLSATETAGLISQRKLSPVELTDAVLDRAERLQPILNLFALLTAEDARRAATLSPFNLTGHPAISVPAGLTGNNLPVGLQLAGPWFAEARLLDLASCLEFGRPQLWPPELASA